jgi:hypothetical protein
MPMSQNSDFIESLRNPCVFIAHALADRETARLMLRHQREEIAELRGRIQELEEELKIVRKRKRKNSIAL